MKFEVLVVASMKIAIFWDVALTLMMEVVRSSETYLPDDMVLHQTSWSSG
jgi:hypothetical protein